MAASLERCCKQAPRTILDLGAGDGVFMLKIARRLASRWQGVSVILLDRQNIVSDETLGGFIRSGGGLKRLSRMSLNFFNETIRRCRRDRYEPVLAPFRTAGTSSIVRTGGTAYRCSSGMRTKTRSPGACGEPLGLGDRLQRCQPARCGSQRACRLQGWRNVGLMAGNERLGAA